MAKIYLCSRKLGERLLSFYGKEPKSIFHLIQECTSCEPDQDADIETQKLLKEYLNRAVIQNPELDKSLTAILAHIHREISAKTGHTLKKTLLDGSTGIPLLMEIKESTKRADTAGSSKPERLITTIIYYAAIANALVFHQQKISTYNYQALKKAFGKLVRKPFMDKDLKGLYFRAIDLCESKTLEHKPKN